MSNEMISVPRDKLKILIAQCLDGAEGNPDLVLEELHALLAKPADPVVIKCWSYKMGGEQRFYPSDPRLHDWGVNMAEYITDVEPLYTYPAAKHQGEPVAWVECSPAWLEAGGDCAKAPRLCVGRGGISHLHPAHVNAQHQGEPVDALLLDDCVEHKHPGYGGGYFGTEVVKLYTRPAEQPAPVAVVLPEPSCRQRLAAEGKPYPRSSCAVCGPFSPKWRECDSLLEVARLNPPQQ